jgi:polysaccharide pyruvyl transferase WcaK-like protein
VAERMKTTATRSTPTIATVVDEIAAGRVVIAMRYHGGVAAALGGRPCVLVGYSPKVPSLAEDLGPAAAPLAWDRDAIAQLPDVVDKVARRDEEMSEARDRLRIREKQNDRALDRLFEAADTSS